MDISYLGSGSVRISGKNIELVTDPLSNFKFKADVVTHSAPATSAEAPYAVAEGAVVLDDPGEYEVKGATIIGVPARLHIDEAGHRGTAFSILVDGVNVVVLGNISGKLDEAQIEPLGQIDVLVVPVGGGGLTLDAEGAAEVVAQLEPSWVVPVHFDDGITQYPVPQAGVEAFLKEMGTTVLEPVSKFKVAGKDPSAETQVVLLSRVGA